MQITPAVLYHILCSWLQIQALCCTYVFTRKTKTFYLFAGLNYCVDGNADDDDDDACLDIDGDLSWHFAFSNAQSISVEEVPSGSTTSGCSNNDDSDDDSDEGDD